MRELKICLQNVKINRKSLQYVLNVKKEVIHKYINSGPNFIVNSHGEKKTKKKQKKNNNTIENMLIFSQWLFQSGEITSEFFPLSICFPLYSKLNKITHIIFVRKR